MCQAAANEIEIQCGREYGFATPDTKLRTTDLSILYSDQLQGLPTNNLAAEPGYV